MMRVTTLLLAATAVSALCACEPYPYYDGYGPPPPAYAGPGYYGGYDDPCVTDSGYCDYGYYQGPVFWSGAWYDGPHRYRDWGGHREYWIHGRWHNDVRLGDHGEWHGPGRYQP